MTVSLSNCCIYYALCFFSDNFDLKQYAVLIPFARLGLLKALN